MLASGVFLYAGTACSSCAAVAQSQNILEGTYCAAFARLIEVLRTIHHAFPGRVGVLQAASD